jgi:predicted metal-dependent hydrolase
MCALRTTRAPSVAYRRLRRCTNIAMVAVQIAFEFARDKVEPARAGSRLATSAARTRVQAALAVPTPAPSANAAERRAVASALEHVLRSRVLVPLRLTITDNRRTMISLRRRPKFVEVRLHHMFLTENELVHRALADYLFESDRHAAQHIARFIEQHREHIRREAPPRALAISTAGAHHDLQEIYRSVNRRYFADGVQAHITWGRDAHRRRRVCRSIKLGSYTARERLIRVHPALDAAYVPRFFVEYIVYHEMLHHVLPPKVQRGRRDLHGPTFKARERMFIDYDAALNWERDNLDRLLRRSHERRHTSNRART